MWEISISATATVDGDQTSIQLSRISGNVMESIEQAHQFLCRFKSLIDGQPGLHDQLRVVLEILDSRWEPVRSTITPASCEPRAKDSEPSTTLPYASTLDSQGS